jgi:hypothetical protein
MGFSANERKKLPRRGPPSPTPLTLSLAELAGYALLQRMFRDLLIVYLLQLVIGAIWIYRGRRRKFKDHHPHCQRCGYDLFGLPAPLLICNECGASLTAKESIEVGFKPRKPDLISRGIMLLIVPIIMLGMGTRFYFTSGKWIPYAPTGWVVAAAGSKDTVLHVTAMQELTTRVPSQTLTDAQWEAMAEFAIVDRSKPVGQWDPWWGSIMKTAFEKHHLSASTRQRYRNTVVAKTAGETLSAWEAQYELKDLDATATNP